MRISTTCKEGGYPCMHMLVKRSSDLAEEIEVKTKSEEQMPDHKTFFFLFRRNLITTKS